MAYPHVPLPCDPLDLFFRLLNLLPGPLDSALRATLHVANFYALPKYDALSYTWGDTTEEKTITVNGTHSIPLMDNLYRALRRLRRHDAPRTVWIDALCINQKNYAERQSQVEFMGAIYRNAQCVEAWLGEAQMSQPVVTASSLWHAWFFCRTWVTDWSCNWPEKSRVATILARKEVEVFEDAISCTSPRWYERAWVAQEFLLASRVRFCAGPRCWSLSELDFATGIAGESCPRLMELRSVLQHRFLIFQAQVIAQSLQFWKPMPYPEMIDLGIIEATQLLRGAQASDARDLIYSILGLINAEEAKLIEVDYNSSFEEVCAKATFASVKRRNGHAILRGTKISQDPQQIKRTSWALDLSDEAVYERFGQIRGPLELYGAPRARSTLAGGVELDHISSALSLSGVKCGRIVAEYQDPGTFHTSPAVDWFNTVAIGSFGEEAPPASRALLRRMFQITDVEVRRSRRVLNHQTSKKIDSPYAVAGWFWHWKEYAYHLLGLDESEFNPPWLKSAPDFQYRADASASCCFSGNTYRTSQFVLEGGLLGTAPVSIAAGDEIVAIPFADFGASPFLILRQGSETYRYRGMAFLYGCMHPDFWEGWHELEDMGERITIS